ncbi:MAG: hypothetical protein DRN15_11435 [Thermoprotei archaeon]|nr:MAG: hypothetical protein DRN15_11435 [Thermoprotei archaeon]
MPRVVIKDFGPFEEAHLELKPLTLIIGKNCVGKSMLVYLVWSLAVLTPDFDKLDEIAMERGAEKLMKDILNKVRRGKAPEEDFKQLVKILIESLPIALASGFKDTLQRTFSSNIDGLVREGKERAVIRTEGPKATMEFILEKNDVKIAKYEPHLEFIERLKVKVREPNLLRISYRSPHGEVLIEERSINSLGDVAFAISRVLAHYRDIAFSPFFFVEDIVALLVDSRAGISRTLLKPYISPLVTRGIPYPDEQFIRLYFKLAEMLERGLIDLEALKPFLKELGFTLETAYEGGVYTIYIRTWTGKRLHFSQAPSGIRESLIVALALSTIRTRGYQMPELRAPSMVIIEEPEAHLHPRAQRLLARLIARAVNEQDKIVLLTTHSDYLVYAINNLIALSQRQEKIRELGYEQSEVLKPEHVAAYLAKAEGRKAVLKRLEVSEEGIPEEEFIKIAEELAHERARITA